MTTGGDQFVLMSAFVRIVAAGSLSAAAQQLKTTQPTVSRQLRALETRLGVQLLNRSTHGMSLTDAGLRYFEYARELLEGMASFEAGLRAQTVVPTGSLRVVVPSAFGLDWLVDVAMRYLKENPQVALEWLLTETPVRFVEQSIDCVVRVGAPNDESAIALKVGEVPRLLVAAPELLAHHGMVYAPDELGRLPWVALSTYYNQALDLFNAGGEMRRVEITPNFTTDHVLASRTAARLGVGAVLISEWAVREDLAEGRLVRILPDWQGQPVPVHLIYPKSKFYPAKLRRFIDIVKDTVPRRLSWPASGGAQSR